ncbi:RNA-directed DNA polymerase, eukaryota, reverse transcriptase zinc-binding domain protein [Tanacetum coccineum]
MGARYCSKRPTVKTTTFLSPNSLIKQRRDTGKVNETKSSVTSDFPPGFTPNLSFNQNDSLSCNKSIDDASKQLSGFSLVERLEETIKVGTTLGLNMEGCETTFSSLIADNGELYMVNFLALQETKMSHIDLWALRQVWGNTHFDFAFTSARGLWVPNDVRLMWIFVYAPQSLSNKISLWSSLSNIISNWDGNLVVMGDFNEVRNASERCDSVLNERQTDIFNEFITNSSLIDISLGGYKFTWTDKIPDHRPILLKDFKVDFGPTPFRFFHSTLEIDGFQDLVVHTWNHDGIIESIGFISFKKKLQNLKRVIRDWVSSKRADDTKLKREHQTRLTIIDAKIDQGCVSAEDFSIRRESMRFLDDLQSMENKDLAQKAKIKWAIEGDENSSFFHGMLKKKQRQIAIKGILKDGDWIEDPIKLQFSIEEIKRAVWDCGREHAPGPDGFSFKFITTFWDLLKEDVARFVHEFFLTGLIPKGCNSSFISLIPKVSNARNILDGPLILNEIMAWYRKRKKNLMVFKVDFEKAFDSLRWDYLDTIMEKLGFGLKWRTWIFGCLNNARSSVLVNESPTSEFDIRRGLRQGDPLSLFLFILAMKGLHMLTCKAEESGIFKDAVWCFFLISGLKINFNKSNLLGVCVPDETVSDMACSIGCGAASFPMKYIGVPVGCNMARCSNWNAIIQRFSSKLSLWKARLLSVGGRLSLIKSVLGHLPSYYMSIYSMPSSVIKKLESMRNRFFLGGDLEERKMTWVRWNKCLASKDHGGLGICSILGLNIGLLFKWILRFWEDVWCGDQALKVLFPRIYLLDTDRLCLVKNRVPSQALLSALRRPPRGGAEMVQFSDLQVRVENIVLSDQGDTWHWALDSSGFSVASVRAFIDSKTLDMSPISTRWIRSIPIKVNIFIWRLMLNKLPYRVNLDRRGIDVGSILCPIFQLDVETINHIFFSCDMALDLWAKLARWSDLDIPMCANISDWFGWIDSLHMSNRVKSSLEGVGRTLMWFIWNYKNRLIFSNSPHKKALLWDSIVSQSYLWISSRNPKFCIIWVDWLRNPIYFIALM